METKTERKTRSTVRSPVCINLDSDSESTNDEEEDMDKRHVRLQYLAMMRTVYAFQNLGEFGDDPDLGNGLSNFGETYVYGSFVREYILALYRMNIISTNPVKNVKNVKNVSTTIDTVPRDLNLFMVYRYDDTEVNDDGHAIINPDDLKTLQNVLLSMSIAGNFLIDTDDSIDSGTVQYRGKLMVGLNLVDFESTDDSYLDDLDECDSGYFANINVTLRFGSRRELTHMLQHDFDVNCLYQMSLHGEVMLCSRAKNAVNGPYSNIMEHCKHEVLTRLFNKQCRCMIPVHTFNNEAKLYCGENDILYKKTNATVVRILRMLINGYTIQNITSISIYKADASSVCVICRNEIKDTGIGFSCCKRAVICRVCLDGINIYRCGNIRLTRTICHSPGHIKCVHCQSIIKIL